MASEKPETDNFLVIIERKIAALKALADSYRAAQAVGALGQSSDLNASVFETISVFDTAQGSAGGMAVDLPTGAFLGKSLPSAIKLYLSAARKKQTTREIATALKEGGVESVSDNFENIVTTALNRLKAAGDLLRFKDGWGLAEFYPASLRSSLTNDAKPTRNAAKAARGKKAVASKSTPKTRKKAARSTRRSAGPKTEKARGPLRPGLEQRIDAYLQTRGNEFTTVQELANQLKVAAPVLNLTLGKMRKAERIEKNQNGLVRLTKKAA